MREIFFGSKLLFATGKLETRCQFWFSAQGSDERFRSTLKSTPSRSMLRAQGDATHPGEVGGGPAAVELQTCVSVSPATIQGNCNSRCFLVSSGDTGVKLLWIGVKLLWFQQACL